VKSLKYWFLRDSVKSWEGPGGGGTLDVGQILVP